jgi:hypothetical protein
MYHAQILSLKLRRIAEDILLLILAQAQIVDTTNHWSFGMMETTIPAKFSIIWDFEMNKHWQSLCSHTRTSLTLHVVHQSV